MGATDPAKAEAGTLRKEFGTSIEFNATHGSDAPETAAFELGYLLSRDGTVARRPDRPSTADKWISAACADASTA